MTLRRPRAPQQDTPRWVGRDDRSPRAMHDDWHAGGVVGTSTRWQAALSRATAYGLWALITLALVLGLVNCAGTTGPPPAPPPVSTPPPVAPPGGCAELVVAAWVSGEADLLADASGNAPADPTRRAAHTYIAGVTGDGDTWGYLVGARVQQRDSDTGTGGEGTAAGWRDLGVQFFTVTMAPGEAGCHGWAPVDLPMQVAPPQLAVTGATPYTTALASSGTALSDTLESFFAGMLTGATGMDRYLAPGTSVPVIHPPPYGEVSLTELRAATGSGRYDDVPADGTTVRLLASVTADAAPLPLVYPVTAVVRGGRWEVTAVDPLINSTFTGP